LFTNARNLGVGLVRFWGKDPTLADAFRTRRAVRRTALVAAALSFGAYAASGIAEAAPAQPVATTVPGAPALHKPLKKPVKRHLVPAAAPKTKATFKPGPEPTSVGPGDRIDVLQRSLGGGSFDSLQCTMGWTVTAANGERLGVTAGHCAPPQHPVGVKKWIVGEVVDSHTPQIKSDPKSPGKFIPVDPFAPDWATFRIIDHTVKLRSSSPQIVPTRVGVAKVGDQVCQLGSSNGYRCGKVTKVTDNWILTDVVTTPGDSGGPLIRTSDHAALGIITDAVTLSDAQTGKVTGRLTQYYSLPSLLNASGAKLATS
jgi:hypothetical protein